MFVVVTGSKVIALITLHADIQSIWKTSSANPRRYFVVTCPPAV